MDESLKKAESEVYRSGLHEFTKNAQSGYLADQTLY